MKNCPYCKIEVGGNLKKCPFCQSRLNGEDERAYFPKQTILRITSYFYKLQLFIIWAVIIGCLGSDFLFHFSTHLNFNFHWSLLVTMWLVAIELVIMKLFKNGFSSARILTIFVLIFTTMLTITAYYLGYLIVMLELVVPIIIMGTMIANFILATVDKNDNALIYLLANVFIGAMPYVVLYFLNRDCPPAWIYSLIVSVILFVGAIIFKGRSVISEIQRRFNV